MCIGITSCFLAKVPSRELKPEVRLILGRAGDAVTSRDLCTYDDHPGFKTRVEEQQQHRAKSFLANFVLLLHPIPC